MSKQQVQSSNPKKLNKPKIIIALFVAIIALTYLSTRTVTGIYVGGVKQFEPTEMPSYVFADEALRDIDIASFQGEVVILHFWATWCTPCVAELPLLSRLVDKYQNRKLRVLTVATDRNIRVNDVIFFLKRLGVSNLPSYIDRYRTAFDVMNSRAVPQSIIIDGNGKMVAQIRGMFDWEKPSIGRLLDYHLDNLDSR